MKNRLLVLSVVCAGLALGGAIADKANEARGRGDSGISAIDDTPKEVIQMPDRFPNVATACDHHGHRIYVTTKSDQSLFLAVIADPACAS